MTDKVSGIDSGAFGGSGWSGVQDLIAEMSEIVRGDFRVANTLYSQSMLLYSWR